MTPGTSPQSVPLRRAGVARGGVPMRAPLPKPGSWWGRFSPGCEFFYPPRPTDRVGNIVFADRFKEGGP